MRYWIQDEVETPQRFPLQDLVRKVWHAIGSRPCELHVLQARGFGLRICEWEDLLDRNDRIQVEFGLLDELSGGTEEWFYDLEVAATAEGLRVSLGLHDSTALFLDAPAEFAEPIARSFTKVRPGVG